MKKLMARISNHSISMVKFRVQHTSSKQESARNVLVTKMKLLVLLVLYVQDQDWKKQVHRTATLRTDSMKMKK